VKRPAPARLGRVILIAAAACFPASRAGAQATLSSDFQSIMQWLTAEASEGLAFNAGYTFDPPDELAPRRLQSDLSLAVGVFPLNKSRFPQLTSALGTLDPQTFLPGSIPFPDLVAHARVGLPDRWDLSLRAADVTLPKGYRLSSETTAQAQNNTFGIDLRRHFWGDGHPLLSVGANFNYLFGRFAFVNHHPTVEPTTGVFITDTNTAFVRWNVASVGLNGVLSRSHGSFRPFIGLGINRTTGSVRAHLNSDFDAFLVPNPSGEASAKVDHFQGRLILGSEWHRKHLSYFINSDIKPVGYSALKTFIVSFGVSTPFKADLGASKRSPEPAPSPKPVPAPSYEPASAPPASTPSPQPAPAWPAPSSRDNETLDDSVFVQ